MSNELLAIYVVGLFVVAAIWQAAETLSDDMAVKKFCVRNQYLSWITIVAIFLYAGYVR